MAANNFTGATDANWGTSTNWSLGAVPTAADGNVATFTAASPNCTVNASNRVCNNIDFTNYTNTITFTNAVTVSGNITLGASMVFAGSGTLNGAQNGTLTSNGKTISIPFAFSPGTGGGCTFTLADDWTSSSTVAVGNANSTGSGCIINGNKFNCTNLTSTAASSRTVSGTTEFIMNSTGTLDGTINFQNNLTINTAGTITMGSLVWGGNTFKRTAGTVTVTGGTTLTLNALNSTLDLSSVTLVNLTSTGGGSPVYTLTSDLTVSGTYTTSAGAPVWNTSTSKKLYLATLVASTNTNVTGTATIEFYATGTWSSSGTNAQIKNNLIFNAGAGTTTISGNIYYNTGTMTYTSGTVTTTGSTLNMAASTTLNTAGISWVDIIITSSNPTITINSLLTATGTLTTSGASGTVTFAGTSGFTVGTWANTTGGMTVKLTSTVTYTTTSLTLTGTAAAAMTFNTTSGGSRAIFTVLPGGTMSVAHVTATDIDSSLGRTVYDYKGTLSNTLNWQLLTNPVTLGNVWSA